MNTNRDVVFLVNKSGNRTVIDIHDTVNRHPYIAILFTVYVDLQCVLTL